LPEAKKKQKETKYLKKVDLTSCKVWYFLVNKDNEIVHKSGYGGTYGTNSACFSSLFYGIPKNTVATYIYHPTDKMGYDEEAINRWVTDISEMGFKCEYLGCWGDQSYFQIKMEDMETKNQYCSTLTLIRCLYEGPESAKVPENYFQIMDTKPRSSKFRALQRAHKTNDLRLGLGHNITSRDNGADVPTLQVLFKRFKSEKTTPFTAKHTSLNLCWAGTDEQYKKQKAEYRRW
jgi:hypothetical protein